jgi:hypothetical protein
LDVLSKSLALVLTHRTELPAQILP